MSEAIKLAKWIDRLPDADKAKLATALMYSPRAALRAFEKYRAVAALQVLRDLNNVMPLSDVIYSVRSSEGKGWDGPLVKKWANAIERLEELLGE